MLLLFKAKNYCCVQIFSMHFCFVVWPVCFFGYRPPSCWYPRDFLATRVVCSLLEWNLLSLLRRRMIFGGSHEWKMIWWITGMNQLIISSEPERTFFESLASLGVAAGPVINLIRLWIAVTHPSLYTDALSWKWTVVFTSWFVTHQTYCAYFLCDWRQLKILMFHVTTFYQGRSHQLVVFVTWYLGLPAGLIIW